MKKFTMRECTFRKIPEGEKLGKCTMVFPACGNNATWRVTGRVSDYNAIPGLSCDGCKTLYEGSGMNGVSIGDSTKTCKTCGQTKSSTEFYGGSSHCKPCYKKKYKKVEGVSPKGESS